MDLKTLPLKFYLLYLSKRWGLSWYASEAYLQDILYDYKHCPFPFWEILRIHRRGFSVYDWCYYGITHENCHTYLTNIDYLRLHPYNGTYAKWIDDKLTLKHVCAGTPLDKYLPKYYYHINEAGKPLRLMDCSLGSDKASVEEIADLLENVGALAIKPLHGAVGSGFMKGAYADGVFFLNAQSMSREAFCEQLSRLRNYLITEYFYPHPDFARYSTSSPGCIRYAACRVDDELKLLASFVRFGTKDSGFIENYGADGALCLVCTVSESGHYRHGTMLDPATFKKVTFLQHPDTGAPLNGNIPHWDDICEAVKEFGTYLPQLTYLGFDFVVTSDSRVKILEINSLSSLDCLQEDRSVFDSPAGVFFRSRLENRK